MKFPLLPYSQLVFDMLQTTPDVYTTRFTLRIDKQEVDIDRLKPAIKKALRNHPAFQMQVDQDCYQRFEPQADVMHGQYHSIDIIDNGSFVDILYKGNRILGDAISNGILVEDIARAYTGKPLQKDHYLAYLSYIEEEKHSSRYSANRQCLEAEYGQIACPVLPNTDVPLLEADVLVEGQLPDDFSTLRAAIHESGEKYLLSLTGFFSLASSLAIMEYNGTDEAALTWAYDGRETEEEQRIYGSLHRDIPFKISRKSLIPNRKSDLIRETRNQIRSGIAHSSYPFTLTKPHTAIWNYALNVLIQPSVEERLKELPFSVEIVEPAEKDHIAYSLLDVEILDGEKLFINYRYSVTHYKESSIHRFATLVRKYAEWLLECEN